MRAKAPFSREGKKMYCIFLTLLCLFLLSFAYCKRTPKRIKQWRRAFKLEVHLRHFQELYKRVDGFALSRQARAQNDAIEYIYGEIDFESFIALLSRFKLKAHSVFYDLGSGSGKAVIACAMVFNVRKSCGIELFQNLHHAAKRVQQGLSEFPEYYKVSKTLFFQHADFLEVSLQDATVVFINSSAFIGGYWVKISQYLERLPKGVIVFSTSKPILSKAYTLLYVTALKMSWGVVQVYVQQRIS